ncbi:RDD family protein [Streptomyces sp. NPDC087422]|uniref:RDD family protein n=1 Tax=Streptomyces sp. NPDC087422 TaxID=3365786 RepID=UPI003812BE57
MSQPPGPPGPGNPYGGPSQPPQQPPYAQNPYGQGVPQQPGPYQQQPGGYLGYPQQQQQPGGYGYPGGGYPGQAPYGYPQGNLPPGMPPLAGWGARLGATLLDALMFNLVPGGLVIAGYTQMSVKLADRWQDCDDAGIPRDACPNPHVSGGSVALILIGGLLSLVAMLFLCYREGSTGQTPGKKIVGIRLLREHDGSTLGFGLAFGRRLLHVLDGLPCYLGFLWPLWDAKKQTFADKMVHTVVIKDQS